jgi:F-type H+-transporting ATPase subunit gamma
MLGNACKVTLRSLTKKSTPAQCMESALGSSRAYPAALRELERRVTSVKAVAKITNTMKLVAQAKLNSARNRAAKTTFFFSSLNKLVTENKLDSAPVSKEAAKDGTEVTKKTLVVLITTDKGMCGSINSNINRFVRNMPSARDNNLIVIGEKGVSFMERNFLKDNIPFTAHTLGLKTINFLEVGAVAERIVSEEYDQIKLVYNRFVGGMKFEVDTVIIPNYKILLSNMDKLAVYEMEENKADLMRDLHEFHVGSAINYSIFQSQASEMASRRNAMDSANKNAQEMIRILSIQFNKLRQATITTELTEIVTGAEVVQEKDA